MKWDGEELSLCSMQQNYLKQTVHIVAIFMHNTTFRLNLCPQK
jgi:hypothetical protein